MNIAFVVGSFPALSETFILNQITGLIDRGHDVDIYASGSRDDPKCHPDIERYRLIDRTIYLQPSLRERLRDLASEPESLPSPARLWAAVRRRLSPGARSGGDAQRGQTPRRQAAAQYDIVHCHFGNTALFALNRRAAGQLRGRLVTTFYGADLTSHLVRHGDRVYEELFRQGDAFLAICDYFRSRLIDIGCPPERLGMQRLGIDPNRFPFIARRSHAGEPVRIVSIARLVEKKGIEYALRALGRSRASTPIEYTIIGDGPLRGDLERIALEMKPGIRVRFAGWLQQDEVAATLRDAHLLLAPSVTGSDGDQEGTPTAILEALASGLPVVATWHSGIPEIIQDGISGRLVPERQVEALSKAIDDLVENPGAWLAMGGAGRAYVEGRHDINKLNDDLVRLYERLAARAAAEPSPAASQRMPIRSQLRTRT